MNRLLLRIATRQSPLALAQAREVASALQNLHPSLNIEFIGITTNGDRFLEKPLYEIGGKSLFVKELEQALLNGQADIAVHSLKDVPIELPPDLMLAAYCERLDPRDAWISSFPFEKLPTSARVGSSSLRRGAQLQALRPDLTMVALRGNINTRLQRLAEGHYDGIVLAAAGLIRLNLTAHVQRFFSIEESLPAIGQGALAIECRTDDTATQALLQPLDHEATRVCVQAERALNAQLGGSCHTPVAGYATLDHQRLTLRGLVASRDGQQILRAEQSGLPKDAVSLGRAVATTLEQQGAKELIAS